MPKKKMRMSAPSPRSRSSQFFEGIDFCYRSSASQVVLSDLPDELIRKLNEYLDPPSLVAISHLNIRRLSKQFDTLQSADFSRFNTIGLQDLQSYFNRERVKHVKDLNFNNVFFVTPYILTTCILKCKNMTKLYVLNCGITYTQIIRILGSCTHLEELYWSIKGEDCHSVKQQKTQVSKSIKKLYLQVSFEGTTFLISEKFLDMCPNTEEFVVNFSPCHATSLPANSATMYFTMQLRLKTDVRSLNILLKGDEEILPTPMRHFIEKVSQQRDMRRYELFELGEGHNVPFYFTRHTSLLQFFDESKYLDELPTLPDKSVKSLVMILNNNTEILNHLNKIKKMTSTALRHLSLHKMSPPHVEHLDADVTSPYVQDVLGGIVANSCNITVLDLSKLHMRSVLPLSSLCNLRKLKVFNVSTCCFIINNTVEEVDYKILDYQNDFKDFIMKCNRVEKFTISDCKAECKSVPMNDILCLVSNWKELKYLIVQNVKALRDCQFLIPIADSCSKLRSLEFSAVGGTEVCHFMSNIKYVLIKSKELEFLRINHPGLYPMDPLLWNNLESAQKLQGLCLSSMLTTAIENKTILDGISKSPHLHLCHLLFKKNCGNLCLQIKRMMASKGVKIPDAKTNVIAYYESFVECNCKHFPDR